MKKFKVTEAHNGFIVTIISAGVSTFKEEYNNRLLVFRSAKELTNWILDFMANDSKSGLEI